MKHFCVDSLRHIETIVSSSTCSHHCPLQFLPLGVPLISIWELACGVVLVSFLLIFCSSHSLRFNEACSLDLALNMKHSSFSVQFQSNHLRKLAPSMNRSGLVWSLCKASLRLLLCPIAHHFLLIKTIVQKTVNASLPSRYVQFGFFFCTSIYGLALRVFRHSWAVFWPSGFRSGSDRFFFLWQSALHPASVLLVLGNSTLVTPIQVLDSLQQQEQWSSMVASWCTTMLVSVISAHQCESQGSEHRPMEHRGSF